MSDEAPDPDVQMDGEYTRYRMSVQRGDGPDRRGKVEVEMVREREPSRESQTVDVGGREVTTQMEDSAFAEFLLESDRSVRLLEERLGLNDDGPEADE